MLVPRFLSRYIKDSPVQKYAVLWNNAQSFTAKPHVEVINKLNSQIIDNYSLKSRSVVAEYYQSRQVISTELYINICKKKKHLNMKSI